MAVTQPAWPSRVPRSESVSDILLSLFFFGGGGCSGMKLKRGESERSRGEQKRSEHHHPSLSSGDLPNSNTTRAGFDARTSPRGNVEEQRGNAVGGGATRDSRSIDDGGGRRGRRANQKSCPRLRRCLAEPPLILQGGNVSCIELNPKLALVWRAEQAQGKGCAGQELSLPFIMEAIGRRRL